MTKTPKGRMTAVTHSAATACVARRRAALAALVLGACLVAGTARAAPHAQTENGMVTGVVAEGMREFLGIRYAAPPVDDLRWQPPQPVPAAMATHAATAFGAHCPQAASPYGEASTTEDCLYLNVYVPDHPIKPSGALPVMFWIPGGGLTYGLSDWYDPAPLVTQGDVIVVTINYRLGYLGFLATKGLDAEGHTAANYGLMDQQFALSWVARNIAGFGGDPTNITMFGESAGGLSTLSNLVSPGAFGLFARAIVESGAMALRLPSLASAETAGNAVAAGLGCAAADARCLRAVDVAAILAAEPSTGMTTIVDGTVLPRSIETALRDGKFNRVPLIDGSNRDEGRFFVTAEAGLPAAGYPAALDAEFGTELGTELAALYPVGKYAQPVLGLAAVLTDQSFACTARIVDDYASRYVPVYAYEFNDRHAPEDFLPPSGYNFGAAHASELQFLFDVPKLPGTRRLNAAERALSASMVQYWTSFAAAASPNSAAEPVWSAYTGPGAAIQSLVPPSPAAETEFSREHHCRFWNPILTGPPA